MGKQPSRPRKMSLRDAPPAISSIDLALTVRLYQVHEIHDPSKMQIVHSLAIPNIWLPEVVYEGADPWLAAWPRDASGFGTGIGTRFAN
jgi:hypothetical protein